MRHVAVLAVAALAVSLCHVPVSARAQSGHSAMPAGSAAVGPITIEGAYARASLGQAPNSAAYMTLSTAGEGDHLLGGASPAAQAVELHTHSMNDQGVMRMRPVEVIEVMPDAPAVLQPGGLHVMLINLTERLEEGGSLPLTLNFARAGEVTFDVPVRGVRAGAAGGMDHGEMSHDGMDHGQSEAAN